MPADEVTHGTDVDTSRARTGPRHAAPKKPLFTRFHVPAGKAIALAAMPTAVLMGMGFTPTLANAEDQPAAKSLTADEYKDCVAALEGESASPSPSASESTSEAPAEDDTAEPTPTPSAEGGTGGSSSSDSGSDDEAAEPEPAPTESKTTEPQSGGGDTATASPSPSPSESDGNLLEDIGGALEDIFTGGGDETASADPSPSATPSASESPSAAEEEDAAEPVKETADKVTDTVEDTAKDTTDAASDAVEDTTEAAEEAAEEATATPSPSASSTTDPEDCPAATDEKGGVDNTVPLPDDPWFLNASSLLLKGADYQGIVKVKTANGTTKEVLKYVISDGTDIGDLHQTVKDPQSGKTYHVQAGAGTTSTIRDGKTIMYTESISGNLLGLIPVTFSPENPPPLNIPLIYFTKVKVQQAGQFGGTLHVPGLHQFTTD
ncbi:hypothetical protein BN159_2988 [Streptomyces davaonensis JCM 4913]|uniref:Membrane-bound hydrophilic protein n=1 Tax=Streptomyces davaonensis (strain DSM 101723 / JCM 4913 / KCC S-0913 / 768) TaxID=1214101 RepID=K4R2L8_STRDJ|nr:hypothetical protein [Streptomyces davaonensis]CCK27367.1 hypothetical protein BN159_2988 [Streptomyces davaonensis JCM 4913]